MRQLGTGFTGQLPAPCNRDPQVEPEVLSYGNWMPGEAQKIQTRRSLTPTTSADRGLFGARFCMQFEEF